MKRTLVAALMLSMAGVAVAQNAQTGKTQQGKAYLQAPTGAALYVFDKDSTPGAAPGAPTCYDQCAKFWPPFLAGADAKPNGDWGVAKRTDGATQWTYRGRPLYTFSRDQTPGKVEGDGFNGNTWHLAAP